MGVDWLFRSGAGMKLKEFGRNAQHAALHGDNEARLGIAAFKPHGQRTAAWNGRVADQQHVEEQLDLVLGQKDAGAFPGEFRLFILEVFCGNDLRVAGVDLYASRACRAESDAGKLKPGRGVAGARLDESHCVFVGSAFFQQFQNVVDRADRRNDVMTDPAAQKRTEVECGKGNGHWHGVFSGTRIDPGLRPGRITESLSVNETARKASVCALHEDGRIALNINLTGYTRHRTASTKLTF